MGLKTATGRWVPLDPAESVPAGVTLLAAEGEVRRDRLPSRARLDRPESFAAAPRPKPAARKGARR